MTLFSIPLLGRGTTGQAVLKLNKEDGGDRKFILVQLPYETKEQEKEKFNICEKITAERVRRVIQGYTYKSPKGKKEKVEGTGRLVHLCLRWQSALRRIPRLGQAVASL